MCCIRFFSLPNCLWQISQVVGKATLEKSQSIDDSSSLFSSEELLEEEQGEAAEELSSSFKWSEKLLPLKSKLFNVNVKYKINLKLL